MAEGVETLGVDFRTRVKNLGAKEKARRNKCDVWFSLIKKNKAFQKNYMKVGVKKLLRAGMVPARTWGVHAVGIASTERPKWRRQIAAAAGKKNTTSLSLPMEAFGLSIWRRALCCGLPDLGRRGMDRKMAHGTKRSMAESDS